MVFDAREIRQRVTDVLEANDSAGIGYLFGSAARGRMGPLSDIDVAVLFDNRSLAATQLAKIEHALCLALRTDRLDVIALNSAPDPLRYRVIRDGVMVYCRDFALRQRFESDVVRRYLDFKPLREMAFKIARKRLSGAS